MQVNTCPARESQVIGQTGAGFPLWPGRELIELGDLLPMAGAEYVSGAESQDETGGEQIQAKEAKHGVSGTD